MATLGVVAASLALLTVTTTATWIRAESGDVAWRKDSIQNVYLRKTAKHGSSGPYGAHTSVTVKGKQKRMIRNNDLFICAPPTATLPYGMRTVSSINGVPLGLPLPFVSFFGSKSKKAIFVRDEAHDTNCSVAHSGGLVVAGQAVELHPRGASSTPAAAANKPGPRWNAQVWSETCWKVYAKQDTSWPSKVRF
jgi:hypothetical protein